MSGFDGYIYSSYPESGTPSFDNTGGIAGGGGGASGGGSIWSGSGQTIWVDFGGVKYPVYVNPGDNDIGFWIPAIFPDDTFVDSPIIIETPGYILIPGGFEWGIIHGVNSPNTPLIIGMLDSVIPSDSFVISFESISKDKTLEVKDTIIPMDNFEIVMNTPMVPNSIEITDTIIPMDNLDLVFNKVKFSSVEIIDSITPVDNMEEVIDNG